MTKIDQMLQLIQSAHASQTRNAGKVPYWRHCANVAEILTSTLELTGETPAADLLADMTIAALGHDLLEDTKVSEGELRQQYGGRATDLIVALTNYEGDDHTSTYLKKIAAASDEAKLIKYCDLLDNTLGVNYGLADLGVEWATSFYLPIALPTVEALSGPASATYPKSWNHLKTASTTAIKLLHLNLKNAS